MLVEAWLTVLICTELKVSERKEGHSLKHQLWPKHRNVELKRAGKLKEMWTELQLRPESAWLFRGDDNSMT